MVSQRCAANVLIPTSTPCRQFKRTCTNGLAQVCAGQVAPCEFSARRYEAQELAFSVVSSCFAHAAWLKCPDRIKVLICHDLQQKRAPLSRLETPLHHRKWVSPI